MRSLVRGQGNKLVLRLDHAAGITCTRGFEIADANGIFFPAVIEKIEGDKVILSSPSVKMPTFVRYGWSGFTDANLINAQGLPASTFQTDIYTY